MTIASVGRQAYLADAFTSACGSDGRVLAYDHDPWAAGCAAARHGYRAPPFRDDAYGPWLVDLCRRERVSLLLTLNADELAVLEDMREELASVGTSLVGMPRDTLHACLDKARLASLCEGTPFASPATWSADDEERIPEAAFPLIAKERFGRGSRGLVRLEDRRAAHAFVEGLACKGDWLLQERIEGQEYGLDLVNDLKGRFAAVLPRRKIRMRAGETDVAETVADPALADAGRDLARRLGHAGLVDVDVLRACGRDHLLDVNPRFGGGYVFSHRAGADVPAALVAWARGREPDPGWLAAEAGVVCARVSSLQRIPATARSGAE